MGGHHGHEPRRKMCAVEREFWTWMIILALGVAALGIIAKFFS